jgi:hypothetical protein
MCHTRKGISKIDCETNKHRHKSGRRARAVYLKASSSILSDTLNGVLSTAFICSCNFEQHRYINLLFNHIKFLSYLSAFAFIALNMDLTDAAQTVVDIIDEMASFSDQTKHVAILISTNRTAPAIVWQFSSASLPIFTD